MKKLIGRWEFLLFLLLVGVFILMSNLSPHFLNLRNLLDSTVHFTEKGVIAVCMTFIIISGNMDLSVASNMAMSAAVMGIAYRAGMGIWPAAMLCLLVGALGGLFNGLVVTRIKLPSMVATLATFSLYRGIAYVLLGNQAITGYPYQFAEIGQGYFLNTNIPNQLVIFLALAAIFGFILHKTTFGRTVYAIGNNEDACRYSGLPVDRIKIIMFTVNGLLAGLSAILLTSRIYSTRPNIALNYELEIITAVVLGGVSIKGGRGSMIGVVLALFLIGASRFGMSLLNIPGQMMTVIIGMLLIVAILLPQFLERFSSKSSEAPGKAA
ncbi:MAG: ABC transporter permease [Bacillota bacterium]|jgi:rhamnose transport system permease protein|nr:ABC transporter permease [Bacillota bacterium]NLJ02414.1 ABC transporter permease [Bacillota bacterium]